MSRTSSNYGSKNSTSPKTANWVTLRTSIRPSVATTSRHAAARAPLAYRLFCSNFFLSNATRRRAPGFGSPPRGRQRLHSAKQRRSSNPLKTPRDSRLVRVERDVHACDLHTITFTPQCHSQAQCSPHTRERTHTRDQPTHTHSNSHRRALTNTDSRPTVAPALCLSDECCVAGYSPVLDRGGGAGVGDTWDHHPDLSPFTGTTLCPSFGLFGPLVRFIRLACLSLISLSVFCSRRRTAQGSE